MSTTNKARGALAKRAASTPAAGAGGGEVSVTAIVKASISRTAEAFADVLPTDADPDRFARLVLTAVRTTPALLECFETAQGEQSVLFAGMQAAMLGLEPNTPTQDCWITPRRRQNVSEAVLTIGYRGKRKLMRRAGNVATVFAEVVREGDRFEWSRGFDRDELVHEPDPAGPVGDLLWVYAVARYTNGGHDAVRLHRTEVEAHRALSDSWRSERARPYSPWTLHTASMWRKTGIHELAKVVDLEPELVRLLGVDEAVVTIDPDGGGFVAATYDRPDDPEPGDPAVAELGQGPDTADDAPPSSSTDEPGPVTRKGTRKRGARIATGATAGETNQSPGPGSPEPAPVDDPAPAAPAPKGPPPPIAPDRPVEPVDDRAATPAQVNELRGLLRSRRGVVGPQAARVVSELLGREVTSVRELDGDDVRALCDDLAAEPVDPVDVQAAPADDGDPGPAGPDDDLEADR